MNEQVELFVEAQAIAKTLRLDLTVENGVFVLTGNFKENIKCAIKAGRQQIYSSDDVYAILCYLSGVIDASRFQLSY